MRVVIVENSDQRSDQSQLVGQAREAWQQLADFDPWDAGGDGTEVAADFGRRIGLEVERIQVARPAR